MRKPNVSIVIPVYKPDENIFSQVKEMIKKQTVDSEIVEVWNNPEAVSMNKGIKKAKGDIVITLAQDCVPPNKYWLEKLIEPLKNYGVVVSVSDLYVPEDYWRKYPLLTRVLTINEIVIRRPGMDARACAYRKKDLIEVGMFNEDPKTIAIDRELEVKLGKLGKIAYPDVVVDHLHPLTNEKKIKMIYNYAEANGKLMKNNLKTGKSKLFSVIRAIPILGILPTLYVFPYKKLRLLPYLLPYILLSPFQHLVELYGFWKGFLFDKESMRNKEVLQGNNKKD